MSGRHSPAVQDEPERQPLVSNGSADSDSDSENGADLPVEGSAATTTQFKDMDLSNMHNMSVIELIQKNPQFYAARGLARVAFGGFVIGLGLMLGIVLLSYSERFWQLGLYLVMLMVFHALEFAVTAIFHPLELSYDSFLLNHSIQYGVALSASVLEYLIEAVYLPGVKGHVFITLVGFFVVFAGQIVRTTAMVTAGFNFTHMVQDRKRPIHKLVTSGIYGVLRHPAYSGWFFWSVGTQVLLGNPFCSVAYTYVSWRFFSERLAYEEYKLHEFFPEYREYKKHVRSGLPFIP